MQEEIGEGQNACSALELLSMTPADLPQKFIDEATSELKELLKESDSMERERSFQEWAEDGRFAAALFVRESRHGQESFTWIGGACNTDEVDHDDLAHAEMNVLRQAHKRLFDWEKGQDFHLFVSAESCTMCI